LPPDESADGPENPENGGTPSAEDGAAAEPSDPNNGAAALEAALSAAPADTASSAYLQRAQLAEDRLGEVLAAYRTLRTENEGFRERQTRNLERRFDQRRERLLLRFIDILDNFDRALESAETSYAGAPLIDGLILVRTQLLQMLKDEGLDRIPVLGLPYDPHTSEAVATQPVDDPDHHHFVVKDVQRGYRLNGKLARPARVIVGEYAFAETPPAGAHEEPHAALESSTGDALAEEAEAELPEAPDIEGDPELDAIIARIEARDPAPAEVLAEAKSGVDADE
jgi:molecular chaperone GrpE